MEITDIMGLVGVVLVFVAHILISIFKVAGNSKVYQFANLFGAIGVGTYVYSQDSWPVMVSDSRLVLGLISGWGIIALWILIVVIKKKKR